MKLTQAQRKALALYADGDAKNETALRIRSNVYDNLVKKGLVKRTYFLQSRITDAGRAALKEGGDA